MKTSLKKLCIFGLGAGLADMVFQQAPRQGYTKDEFNLVIEMCAHLKTTSLFAIEKSRIKVTKKMIDKVKVKIDKFQHNATVFDITEALSFLLLGVQDLIHFCNDKTYIQPVEDAAMNFVTVFDPNLEDEDTHASALERYKRWIEDA